ncbi:hypothetical protein V6N11_008122 [Hibiscus sabdariffa]|uniref:Uncharacterized protein n=1 Tax=Hibiscus sabdariffa TaxID=183260 RepID=A0ABR2PZP0_9ROSI
MAMSLSNNICKKRGGLSNIVKLRLGGSCCFASLSARALPPQGIHWNSVIQFFARRRSIARIKEFVLECAPRSRTILMASRLSYCIESIVNCPKLGIERRNNSERSMKSQYPISFIISNKTTYRSHTCRGGDYTIDIKTDPVLSRTLPYL